MPEQLQAVGGRVPREMRLGVGWSLRPARGRQPLESETTWMINGHGLSQRVHVGCRGEKQEGAVWSRPCILTPDISSQWDYLHNQWVLLRSHWLKVWHLQNLCYAVNLKCSPVSESLLWEEAGVYNFCWMPTLHTKPCAWSSILAILFNLYHSLMRLNTITLILRWGN